MQSKTRRELQNPKMTPIYLLSLLMFVFICELGFGVWCRVQSQKISYVIVEQTKRMRQLTAMQDNLKIELARLRSPQRIMKIARDQLGLKMPTPAQTVVIP